ncbi:calcium-binding protein [Alloyangia pacifica]|uniref:Hemolysin-type calcium-binding repeat-containing protein n=1 Tax=Alloyangia pacifica TaxID=311180 RepID=A0A1I6VG85_9RHOB|nr:calcium-binding protein [Alloyangia pacifica]SDH96328.1 hypothetical protein SAMN04488245_11136 [Alloyangia pacifica]SFT12657.1 hypothetical protein SAMN04488050_11137 [Alloyangia pacifica]
MKFRQDILPFAHEDGDDHEPVRVFGSNRPDEIVTGGGPQHILAGNGDDSIRTGGGPDLVEAGNGDDAVFAEGGPDSVWGGNGDDLIDGGGGPDALDGGRGDDTIIGGAAADTLTGGAGRDAFVYRSASEAPAHGSDEDEDHEGKDAGDDHAGGGLETITDFKPGTDLVDFSGIGSVVAFAAGPATYSVWAEQQGADTLLYVDTDGALAGDHPAEMSILLLNVDVIALSEGDFLF